MLWLDTGKRQEARCPLSQAKEAVDRFPGPKWVSGSGLASEITIFLWGGWHLIIRFTRYNEYPSTKFQPTDRFAIRFQMSALLETNVNDHLPPYRGVEDVAIVPRHSPTKMTEVWRYTPLC